MRLDVSLFSGPANEERRHQLGSRLRPQPLHLGMREEPLGQFYRIRIRANPLHVDAHLPIASNGKHSPPLSVRQVEVKLGRRSQFRLAIRRRPKTNLSSIDSQIAAQSPSQQSSADHKLIARSGKLETRHPLSLVRFQQLEQRVRFFLPGFKIDVPHVDFVVRQDAIGMAQRFWLRVGTNHNCRCLPGASLCTDRNATRLDSMDGGSCKVTTICAWRLDPAVYYNHANPAVSNTQFTSARKLI